MSSTDNNFLKPSSLIIVGNLPDKTRLTFANSIKGARLEFGDSCEIKRVTILETEQSMHSADDRNLVIRDVLGPFCTIICIPCLDDFRVRAFQAIADELQRKDVEEIIVDITNGQRNQTFDLIIATSICRIENVILTSVPRDCLATPYNELDPGKYTVTRIRPFSQDPSLEAAAHFELIYYADRIRESVQKVRDSEGGYVSDLAGAIELSLGNAIVNYFSDNPGNLDNALKQLSELHETIAIRLGKQISEGKTVDNFASAIDIVKKLSSKARVSTADKAPDDQDLLAAAMLAELLNFCREYRNYVAHPYHRRISKPVARLMIFATFTILEQTAILTNWLGKTKNSDVHSN